MKLSNSLLILLSIVSAANAIATPGSHSEQVKDLFKRKGGGGGGGRGGGSSGSGGSKSGGSSGSSSGKGSSSSNTGGKTTTGSGVTPRFGGGKYYGGGASVPYRSGNKTPSGLIPLAIIGGGLLFWSGLWLAGAWAYYYTHPYSYYNITAARNETHNVTCICQPYVECGCDDNGDYTWLDEIIGNGSYAALNDTLIFIGEVNGTTGIYINGTLPNGTTASGGDDDPNGAVHLTGLLGAVGFWPVLLAMSGAVLI